MSATLVASTARVSHPCSRRTDEEHTFYAAHAWCVDPHLTAEQAAVHLRDELDTLLQWPAAWQRREASINVWLLASGILNAVDELLRGKTARIPALRRVSARAERLIQFSNWRARRSLRRWRDGWLGGLEAMLPPLIGEAVPDPIPAVLRSPLPPALAQAPIGIPSPFERLDFSHEDVLALGRALSERLPDRETPLALIGLRTSGSYFAPLLKSQLLREGYRTVVFATLEPSKGPDRDERSALEALAAQGFTAVLVDDPPTSGAALRAAVSFARAAGFERIKILVPTHPASRDWAENFPTEMVVTLAPEDWHKRTLMQVTQAEAHLTEYLGRCRVIASERAERFTKSLVHSSSEERVRRLKRIYEVERESPTGTETLFVMAKSVGWGWYGTRAFIAAHALRDHVPEPIGCRDGILYTRYVLQPEEVSSPDPQTAADYVAARVRGLPLPGLGNTGMRNGGVRLLAKALSGAYGRFPFNTLARNRLAARLRALPCPLPCWIDGNMQMAEWIASGSSALKTDAEHHGLGKAGLNVVDPAVDLAGAILHGDFTAAQEEKLIASYAAACGDWSVGERLFTAKLLAGVWSMNQAYEQIVGSVAAGVSLARANERFLRAWHFLIAESARFSGRILPRPQRTLRAPLVFLDVDGVIDRRAFGFPTTSAAGLQALATLSSHSVVLNTARSAGEVQTYCEAYNLCGGVAEYGSYLWDAVRGQGRVLVGAAALEQLHALRAALKAIPGVFVDDRYQYSVRAFTYRTAADGRLGSLLAATKRSDIGEGMVAPLSPVLLKQVIVELGLDALRVHPTTIDTSVVAREVGKGTGLVAFRDWALGPETETIAVGDSEADLPLFRAATRAFAPANIGCRRDARLLGCRIVSEPYQRGLLQIAQAIAGTVAPALPGPRNPYEALIADLLSAADRPLPKRMRDILLDRSAWSILLR